MIGEILKVDKIKSGNAFIFVPDFYRVRYFWGRVSNFKQSGARKHCFPTSDWLKFETLPLKYLTL